MKIFPIVTMKKLEISVDGEVKGLILIQNSDGAIKVTHRNSKKEQPMGIYGGFTQPQVERIILGRLSLEYRKEVTLKPLSLYRQLTRTFKNPRRII